MPLFPPAHYGNPAALAGRGFIGALDDYEGLLLGAVSAARRLFTSYTANKAMRVRRSSDNTEQDVGFSSSGGLDTSALLSFCGAGDGFVVALYDQLGSNNFTQSTATKQPKIVESGSVLLYNNKPAAKSDGYNDRLDAGSSVNWSASSFVVTHYPIESAGSSMVIFGGDESDNFAIHYSTPFLFSGALLATGTYSNNAGAVFGAALNGASSYARNQLTTFSGDVGAGGSGTPVLFGHYNDSGYTYNGAINELLWAASALSNANIDSLCAEARTFYGL